MRFSSGSYELFSGGKKPSGRGNWAFCFDRGVNLFFFNGLFSEAKKEAMKEGKRRNAKLVQICS